MHIKTGLSEVVIEKNDNANHAGDEKAKDMTKNPGRPSALMM